MWWSFKNAAARKLAYVLVGLLAALVAHYAHAQNTCPTYDFVAGNCTGDSPSAVASCREAQNGANHSGGLQSTTCAATAAAQAAISNNCENTILDVFTQPGCTGDNCTQSGTYQQGVTVNQTGTGPCAPNSCGAKEGSTFIVQGTTGPISGTIGGTDNCQYQAQDGVSLAFGIPNGYTLQTAVATGSQESGTEQPGPEVTSGTPANACITLNGNTTCFTYGGDTPGCGQYNGDQVCVGAVANNTCAATASGGAVCAAALGTSVASPPGPDNGTPGVPATPAAQLVDPQGNVSNLYTAAQVKGSSGPVSTTGTTASTSSSGTGTGTQTTWNGCLGTTASPCAVVPVPSAANGDCAATGTCGSDGTVPTLATEPDVGTSLSTYWTALGNVPIVAAFSGILNALPSAECPTYQLSMFQQTYTMDQQCTIMSGMASVVAAVMLAIYTLTGVRILMST